MEKVRYPVHPSLWPAVAPEEEDAARGVVHDEKEEGVVGLEVLLLNHAEGRHTSGGRRRLCALLGYVAHGAVRQRGDKEPAVTTHARQVGAGRIEKRAHAKPGHRVAQGDAGLQLEAGQMQDHITAIVKVGGVCPF